MTIAAVRDYWDRRPCNIRHSNQEVGTREYFEGVRARKYFVEPHIPGFAQFDRWKGKRVLDAGCGIGTDTIEFARAGAHVTAVDLSLVSLLLLQRRVLAYGVAPRVDGYMADLERLADTVPVAPYDLIYSFGVVHHTPRPGLALRQLTAYAGPETELRLMLYHRLSTKALGLLRYWRPGMAWDDAVARQSEAQSGCPVTHTYTRGMARRLLRQTGWQVLEMHVAHIFPYRIPDYREYRYVRAFPWSHVPRPLFRWLESRLGWHLLMVARRQP